MRQGTAPALTVASTAYMVSSLRMDPKFHRWLLDAFDRRLQGDYGFEAAIAPEEVNHTIQQAAEFLQAAECLIAAGS